MLLSMELAPQHIVLILGLCAGAATDLWTGRIPNVLTFPMMALGIATTAISPTDPWMGLLGCAAAFAVHFPLFALGIEKGGDAKLMMGVGACLGWAVMLETTLWLAVLYLPIGLLILTLQGKLSNLVAVGRYALAQARGQASGPPPEPTLFRTGAVIAVSGLLAWLTDAFAWL